MTKREELRFKTAHEEYGYSKLSSEHLAFEKGAEWADNNPSDEIINKICILNSNWMISGEKVGLLTYIKNHWNDNKRT